MRNVRVPALFVVAVLGVTLLGCTASEEADTTQEEGAFRVGETVAAEWGDGKLYLSEVTAVADGEVTVTYLDDGTSGTLDESEVRSIEEKDWQVDDRVLAVWSVARFYSGTITEVQDTGYIVDWDDGSTPSLVSADMILAYEAAYAD